MTKMTTAFTVSIATAMNHLLHSQLAYLELVTVRHPQMALHLARQALRLSENITIYTHGNEALAEEIEAAKVASNPDVNSKCRSKINVCNYSIQKFIPNDNPSSGLTVVFDKKNGAELGDHTHQCCN